MALAMLSAKNSVHTGGHDTCNDRIEDSISMKIHIDLKINSTALSLGWNMYCNVFRLNEVYSLCNIQAECMRRWGYIQLCLQPKHFKITLECRGGTTQ